MRKNFSNEKVLIDKTMPSIFLAGPTLRNNNDFTKSWRYEACELLADKKYDGIVYIPEKDGIASYDFLDQVEWERKALMNASVILFYIPRKFPELPGFTTNVEFGYYLAKRPDSIVLCCPKDSEKNEYLKWLYKKDISEGEIFNDLNIAINACLLKIL